ncbi:carboxylic ester hydrolase [Spirochaetia bacterium]|nr:carboxylic ester hydrolase [Spirochaetia bacterium]
MPLNTVTVRYGKLRGVQKIGYSVFRGVPYARPPVGALRWKKPEPPESWQGIREAKTFASRPIEEGSPPGSFYHKEFFADEDFLPPTSEDCLYLNIWTPAENTEAALPTAFWIHGGAFINGFASEMEFDGAAFARQGVILVTVGHRLGALGYLSHPWLSEEGGGASGNYGLYDLAAALDWVRENISSFGGDPEKITVFGQSAGAVSVQALVSSPLTRGKISGAIIQSGGGYRAGIGRSRPLRESEDVGLGFAEKCGAKSLEEWRRMDSAKILSLQMALFNDMMSRPPDKGGGLPFGPCIDGKLLEDDADLLLEKGAHHPISYMIGCCANDIGMSSHAAAGEKPPLYNAAVNFSLLNEKLDRDPAYVYYFTHRLLGDDAGAFHSAELWYIFGTLDRSWRPKIQGDYDFSERMVSYWCNFVKHKNPNGQTGKDAGANRFPYWETCTNKRPFVMELKA